MKYLIYAVAFFLLMWKPAPVTNGQSKKTTVLPLKIDNNELKRTVAANQDTISDLIKVAEAAAKPKYLIKYKYIYRTRIKEIRDTVYIAVLPGYDSSFIIDACPPDTVFIDRPILVRKKSWFQKIF